MGAIFKYLTLLFSVRILSHVSGVPLIGFDLWLVYVLCFLAVVLDTIVEGSKK